MTLPETGSYKRILILFFEILATIPLALIVKCLRTFSRAMALLLASSFVVLSGSLSSTARTFFIQRVQSLAVDVADWLLWPFSVVVCLCRLLLAAIIHPILYCDSAANLADPSNPQS